LVTTHKDEQGRPTIYDDLPEDMPRVMSVGRLDLNSEGLLLLTNDGGLKRQLELPSTGWLRRYRVRVKGNPTDTDLEPLRQGIVVDREKFQPMQVSLDRTQGANAWLTVGLREGKNREILRAMENIGLSVNRLIRVSYGPFQLGPLKPGDVEEVRRRVLRDQLGIAAEEDSAAANRPRATRADRPDRRAKPPVKPGGKPGTKGAAKAGPKSDAKTGQKPTKSKDHAGDAPWETSSRPRLTRRRPKKN
jgi:23S rRNA pseudouridine2605 synthase